MMRLIWGISGVFSMAFVKWLITEGLKNCFSRIYVNLGKLIGLKIIFYWGLSFPRDLEMALRGKLFRCISLHQVNFYPL